MCVSADILGIYLSSSALLFIQKRVQSKAVHVLILAFIYFKALQKVFGLR